MTIGGVARTHCFPRRLRTPCHGHDTRSRGRQHLSPRQPPLDFGPYLEFHRPLAGNPTPRRWPRFIDHLLELGDDAFDLLVIDTMIAFLPAACARRSTSCVWSPVYPPASCCCTRRALSAAGPVAVVPCGPSLTYSSTCRSRSATALPGAAISTEWAAIQERSRRSPPSFNPEGTDYRSLPDDPPEAALPPTLETLRRLLRDSPEPLTRQEILARWPEGVPAPRADSLWRTLIRGCELGILDRSGEGTRAEPFHYGLAADQPGV